MFSNLYFWKSEFVDILRFGRLFLWWFAVDWSLEGRLIDDLTFFEIWSVDFGGLNICFYLLGSIQLDVALLLQWSTRSLPALNRRQWCLLALLLFNLFLWFIDHLFHRLFSLFRGYIFSILLLKVLLCQDRQFRTTLANYNDKVQLALDSIELL